MYENMRLGTELTAADQREVLGVYVHRFTGDHKPAWAHEPRPDGSAYAVQFASDAEWLAHTRFAVTKAGKLDHRAAGCFSEPTWPEIKRMA